MLKLARKGLIARKNRTYQSAAVAKAHDQAESERLLEEGLAAAELQPNALGRLPGSEIRKVALADLLLRQTLASQSWIADRLAMRSAANVSQQVRRFRGQKKPKLSARFESYLNSVKICSTSLF
jgi:putative transposase